MAMNTTEERGHRTGDIASAPLTPEVLSGLLKITAPRGGIAVQGIAQDVRAFPIEGPVQQVYGRLTLGRFSIRFRAPPEAAPDENQAVIVKGYLSVSAVRPDHDWRATHEIMLVGHVVGTWIPRSSSDPFTEIPLRGERCPLQEFVRLDELLVLCSGTAERDITASLRSAGLYERPRFETMNFGSEAAFLEKLEALIVEQGFSALVIARGGGAGIDEIGNSRAIARTLVEAGIPFYTAIGHDTNVVLLDKLADQAFHTPSGFAAAWAQSCRERWNRARQQRRLTELQQQVDEQSRAAEAFKGKLSDLQQRFARSICAHRHGLSISWPVLIILAGFGALATWAWPRFLV